MSNLNTFRIRSGFSVHKAFVAGDTVRADLSPTGRRDPLRCRAPDGTDCNERMATNADSVVNAGFTVLGVFIGGDALTLSDAEVVSHFAKLEATDAASQSALDTLTGKITAPTQ